MKTGTLSKKSPVIAAMPNKQLSYGELVEFLDSRWDVNSDAKALTRVKELDKALGSVAKKVNTIFVTGSNGKSLTTQFTAKLLREEGLSVGTLQEPHILTYNERFSLNGELMQNKVFTELGNKVVAAARDNNIEVGSRDILTMMAYVYFAHSDVDVAIFEVGDLHAKHPATINTPKVAAVTRVTDDLSAQTNRADEQHIRDTLSIVTKGVHVVSADQGKLNLQLMQSLTEERGGQWVMPIRKLAPLSYPFEQLHGRCAALAERIAHIFVNEYTHKDAMIIEGSLLTKKKGQRGRPTLEAKRQSEMNPRKTLEQFWKETISTLPGRFQLLDKEKPMVLLDNADNLDAFQNLLLGIRLLHYKRPLKGLVLILGCNNPELNTPEFLKLLRYFFKKASGNVIVCPAQPAPGNPGTNWDAESITNDIKNMKVKTICAQDLNSAFDSARSMVDERDGLIVVTGSSEIIADYWRLKGMKRLAHEA